MKLNLVKNYKTYDRYKDSGVEWLGEIPENFKLWKIYQMFEVGRGRVISKEELLDDGKYPIYSSQTKNQGIFGYINTYDFNGNYLTWTTDGANAGSVFRRKGQFNCTNVCGTLKLRNNNKFSINFLRYSLLLETKRFVRDDLNPKLMSNVISKIRVLVPDDIQTQQKIAGYLDEKTETIDKIIKRKKKLIELLEEKRKKVINKVLLKNREDCSKRKIKFIAPLRNEKLSKEDIDPQLQYIALENIRSWRGELFNLVAEQNFEGIVNRFYKDDVLFGKLRPYLAKAFLAGSGGVCSGELLVMKPDKKEILPKYLFYKVLSKKFIDDVNNSTFGAKMPRANWEFIGNMEIIIPNINKQQEIIDYLDKKTEDIDKTIKKINQSINLLTEYKSSLISHVVTGKVKVN